MLKHTIVIFSLAVALVFACTPLQSVHGVISSGEELAAPDTTETEALANSEQHGAGGNAIVRAVKAPFKALRRLFSRGKKNSPRLERISENDIKHFASSPANQIQIAEVVLTDPANNSTPNQAVDARVYLEKGRALLGSGDLNQAIDALARATWLDPTLAEAQTLLGVAYHGKGLPELAVKSFAAAVAAENHNPQHLNNLGYQLYRTGDYEGAAKFLKRAAKLAPDDARIWNNLGLTQFERGKFDDAVKSFAHSIGEAKGRLTVANRLQAQGDTKEAIKHLEKARLLLPNSSEVLAQLVTLYELSGKNERAENTRRSLSALHTPANITAAR